MTEPKMIFDAEIVEENSPEPASREHETLAAVGGMASRIGSAIGGETGKKASMFGALLSAIAPSAATIAAEAKKIATIAGPHMHSVDRRQASLALASKRNK